MHWYLYLILAYLFILLGFNFYRSFKVKTQDEMMVAGRSLSMRVMVFTLICTWIGSGTFIAGAEYAAKAGWSSLWLPAGAWVGIILIYFLAEKIRTFGKYTIGDILEGNVPVPFKREMISRERITLEYFDPRLTEFANLDHCGSQCSSCGACRDCGICIAVCPRQAISKNEPEDADYEYVVDENLCIGCGFCAAACPCGVWDLIDNVPIG